MQNCITSSHKMILMGLGRQIISIWFSIDEPSPEQTISEGANKKKKVNVTVK